MENTTVQKILEETIRNGATAYEFEVVVESTTLLALLLQEAYLHRENKQTMSDDAYIALSEHLYFNVDKLKSDKKLFAGIAIDKGEERLVVTRKRFPKKLQDFANARWDKFEAAREEAEANAPTVTLSISTNGGSVDSEKAAEDIKNLKSDYKSLEEVKETFETMINSRRKGGDGERQVIKLLQPIIDQVFIDAEELNAENIPLLQRNLEQVRGGGYDIVGIDFLALEIKTGKTLQLDKWFEQTKEQAGEGQHAVLIYKTKGKWRVMMFGFVSCGKKSIRTNVDIDMSAFIVWFECMLKQMVGLDV